MPKFIQLQKRCCRLGMFCKKLLLLFLTISGVFAFFDDSFGGNNSLKNSSASCNVFEPFRVLPKSSQYQIGGAIPLHYANCVDVNADSVQEIVAIQWMLSQWNQKADKKSIKRPKMGFFGGDSCSRPKESILQTFRFLEFVGFNKPEECRFQYNEQELLQGLDVQKGKSQLMAVLSPKDVDSALALANVLKPFYVPIGVFTSGAAQVLLDSKVKYIISTAPTIYTYLEAFLYLMSILKSNLVIIIDGGESSVKMLALSTKVSDVLKQNGIFVSEIIGYDHPLLSKIVVETDAYIILSLVSHSTLKNIKFDEQMLRMNKIWVSLDLESTIVQSKNSKKKSGIDFLSHIPVTISNADINLQSVVLQQQDNVRIKFNEYFLHVLKSHYLTFPILTSYVEQLFQCSIFTAVKGKNCSLLFENNGAAIKQASLESQNIDSVLNLIYTLALIAEKIETTPELQSVCTNNLASTKCYDTIMQTALSLKHLFPNDESNDLNNKILNFHRHKYAEKENTFLLQSNLVVEALLLERVGRDGLTVYKIFDMQTASNEPKFHVHSIPSKLKKVQSTCPPYRSYCGHCEYFRKFEKDEIFLSNPRQYSLYLSGLFDFHGGPNCEIFSGSENIALPLAFSYAVTSYSNRLKSETLNGKSMMNHKNYTGLDFGAILVDSCSSDRKIMEFLVESENGCYRFTQSDRNWTIVAGSTFGYISTSSPSLLSNVEMSLTRAPTADVLPSVVERFFTNKNSPTPVLTLVDKSINHDARNKRSHQSTSPQFQSKQLNGLEFNSIFSAMPSHRSTAVLMLKYMRKMRFEFVNVVLDESDADSVAIYNDFEKLTNSLNAAVCLSETIIFNSNHAAPRIAGANGSNLTILFMGPRAAADYLSGHLRQNSQRTFSDSSNTVDESEIGLVIHMLVGDAVDFHLYDPVNVAHYSGAITIQPKDVLESDFRDWLTSVTPLLLPETWFWRYVEEQWKCALSLSNIDVYQGRMCTGDELLNVAQMGRMTKAGYLAKSTKIFLAAADQIYQKLCYNEYKVKSGQVCKEFLAHGRLQIRNILAQTHFDDEFEILEFQPIDHHGNFGYTILANYSTQSGFHLINSYKTYANGELISSAQPISRCVAPLCRCAVTNVASKFLFPQRDSLNINFDNVKKSNLQSSATYFLHPLLNNWSSSKFSSANEQFLMYDTDSIQALNISEWRSDTLKYVFLAVTSVFCIFALATLILVGVKMFFRIVKGNQTLGISLLIGIFTLYFSAYIFILDASESMCSYRVMAHAISHTICFGVLIVKAVQLKNAETLGIVHSHQISHWNYLLLLIFVFLVQIVICFRWLANPVPSMSIVSLAPFSKTAAVGKESNTVISAVFRCSNSTQEFFLAESYSFLLLLFALFLNALNRNIKCNYKEAKWLFAASFACTIIMSGWIIAHVLVSPLYMDYITIAELYLCGTVLLMFVFGPKIYILLSYEPIIVENEKAVYNGKGSQHINVVAKSYDLFEADWTLPTPRQSVSSTLSTRTRNSPISKLSLRSSNSSDRETAESINNSKNKKYEIKNKNLNEILASKSSSYGMHRQLIPQLNPMPFGAREHLRFNDVMSDNNELSSVLQTVLRKKTTPTLIRKRRSQSKKEHNVRHVLNHNPVFGFPNYNSFIVLPRISQAFVTATAPLDKKRSTLQKSKK